MRFPSSSAGPVEGTVHSINVSDGGVPKRGRQSARVSFEGVHGDRQRDLAHHGGPERAVSLYSLELIEDLQAEGHPIVPGSIGENLTLTGVNWSCLEPGVQLHIGEAIVEITRSASPCEKIAGSFRDGRFVRVSEKIRPGWSRFYSRVVREGRVAVGDRVSSRADSD